MKFNKFHKNKTSSIHSKQSESVLPFVDFYSNDMTQINHSMPNLSTIKAKIPSRYFRSETLRSMMFVGKDIFFIALSYNIMNQLETVFEYGFVFFPIFWYIQGNFLKFFSTFCAILSHLFTY